MRVFLNPGHAIGLDPGAINKKHDVYEAEIVADIGELVEHYLKEAGCEVYTLQSDNLDGGKNYNEFFSVVKTANRWDPDIFVSIHCNSHSDEEAQGTETYAYSEYSVGNLLAKCIQQQIVKSLDVVDRGVKYNTGYAVLRETQAPAVLVETAFISNEHDVQLLLEDTDEFARAIARGITDYAQEDSHGKI